MIRNSWQHISEDSRFSRVTSIQYGDEAFILFKIPFELHMFETRKKKILEVNCSIEFQKSKLTKRSSANPHGFWNTFHCWCANLSSWMPPLLFGSGFVLQRCQAFIVRVQVLQKCDWYFLLAFISQIFALYSQQLGTTFIVRISVLQWCEIYFPFAFISQISALFICFSNVILSSFFLCILSVSQMCRQVVLLVL